MMSEQETKNEAKAAWWHHEDEGKRSWRAQMKLTGIYSSVLNVHAVSTRSSCKCDYTLQWCRPETDRSLNEDRADLLFVTFQSVHP